MTVEVLRPFDGHDIGEQLDASAWLWTAQLIEQRYVRQVHAEVEKPIAQTGRRRTEGS